MSRLSVWSTHVLQQSCRCSQRLSGYMGGDPDICVDYRPGSPEANKPCRVCGHQQGCHVVAAGIRSEFLRIVGHPAIEPSKVFLAQTVADLRETRRYLENEIRECNDKLAQVRQVLAEDATDLKVGVVVGVRARTGSRRVTYHMILHLAPGKTIAEHTRFFGVRVTKHGYSRILQEIRRQDIVGPTGGESEAAQQQ